MTVPVGGAFHRCGPADVTLVCADKSRRQDIPARLPDHIRRAWRLGHVVGGIGIGAFVLAEAGILNGTRFTLHWDRRDLFLTHWPELAPKLASHCVDSRIITCGGGVAVADLILELIEARGGSRLVQQVMDMSLILQRRPKDGEQTSSAAARLVTRNDKIVKALEWCAQNFLENTPLKKVTAGAGVTQRQLQRLFRSHLELTPIRYINQLRLNHSMKLLSETNMAVSEVARACAYESTSTFSRQFRRKFGMPPHRFSNVTKNSVMLDLPAPV